MACLTLTSSNPNATRRQYSRAHPPSLQDCPWSYQENVSTEHLFRLGVLNTIDELIEAQRTAQVQLLCSSVTRRWFPSTISNDTSAHPPDLVSLTHAIWAVFCIKPLPKNMFAGHHDTRRQAKVAMLRKENDNHPAVCVDAAHYASHHGTFAIVCVSPSSPPHGKTTAIATTVRTT